MLKKSFTRLDWIPPIHSDAEMTLGVYSPATEHGPALKVPGEIRVVEPVPGLRGVSAVIQAEAARLRLAVG